MTNFFSNLLITLSLLIPVNAIAGLIESDVYGDGSNKGFSLNVAGYGLEWLDFGNPTLRASDLNSAKNVISSLSGGWRLPSPEEVEFLWSNLFLDDRLTAYRGYVQAVSTPDLNNLWLSYLPIMGSNYDSGNGDLHESTGIYEDNGIVRALRITSGEYRENYSWLSTAKWNASGTLCIHSCYKLSALAVRSTREVPEPSSVAIFGLALCALIYRKAIRVF